MFIEKNIKSVRVIAIALLCVMLVGTLCSCSSAPIKSSDEELAVVGTVADHEVSYDELYFLTLTYREALDAKYGAYATLDEATAALYEEELRQTVYSNIIANYAILELCRAEGLTLESDGLDDRVQDYIDQIIETDFEGKRSKYKESLREYGLTDRYVRFTASVDLLYSDLKTLLLQDGTIEDDDEKIISLINSEFVRTIHIAIFNDDGEDVSANLAKAEEALEKYNSGDMSMYELIGSSYNEDFSITTFDGYYFGKGSMDEDYEKAAFALEENQVSGVIRGKGVNSKGDNVPCFYIIKRLPMEADYISKNFEELKGSYIDTVLYGMLEDKKEGLAFVANDYGKSLDLATADAPKAYVPWLEITFICVGAIAVVGGAVALTIVLVKRKKAGKAV